jgi:hypothetical protein
MWASVIEGVGLNLFCFSFEFFTAVMGPLILALTGIGMVAHSPFSRFAVIGAFTPDRLVGCGGGGVDVLVGHIDVAR